MADVGQNADFSGVKRRAIPLRSCPSEQRRKSSFCPQPQGVAAIIGRRLRWLRAYSPLRGCLREAVLPAAYSYSNGLNAIKSAVPQGEHP